MTTHTTKIQKKRFTWIGLPVLYIVLVAFQYMPKPQIKTKEDKIFDIKNNQSVLKQHTLTKYNIHGEMIEYTEYAVNNQQESTPKFFKLLKYNPQGLLVGTMAYDQDNTLVWSQENKYNSKDQVTKMIYTDYSDNVNNYYISTGYDSENRMILQQKFDYQNNQITEKKKNYNTNGELIATTDWFYINKDQKSIKKIITTEYEYNQLGQIRSSVRQEQEGKNKLKDIRLFENGAVVSWTKLENGKILSHFKHKQRDSISIDHKYVLPPANSIELEYDDDKRDPLQNISHKAYKTITVKSDKEGLPIKKVTREYNQVVEVVYYYYDSQKRLLRERILDKNTQNITENYYTYDGYNNIIENRTYHNGTLVKKMLLFIDIIITKKRFFFRKLVHKSTKIYEAKEFTVYRFLYRFYLSGFCPKK